MSYETFSDGSTVGFRATGERRDDAFREAVRAFSATVGAVGSGTERHRVTVSGSTPEELLAALLESLLELQAEGGGVVSHADALEILDDDGGYRLTARVGVDPSEAASGPNPDSVDGIDVTGREGEWRLEAAFRRSDLEG